MTVAPVGLALAQHGLERRIGGAVGQCWKTLQLQLGLAQDECNGLKDAQEVVGIVKVL